MRVTSNVGAGQRATFGLSVLVASDLSIECALSRVSTATSQAIQLAATLTEYGDYIEGTRVSLSIDRPKYSRGELWATMSKPRAPGHVSPDYANDSVRDRLSSAVERDERFRARALDEVPATLDMSTGRPVYRAVISNAGNEGSYHYRFVAEVERNGLVLRRECAHTFAVIAEPSVLNTEAQVIDQAQTRSAIEYRVQLRPRDGLKSSLGPSLLNEFHLSSRGGKCSALKDLGDGGYQFLLSVPRPRPQKVVVHVELRNTRLRWNLEDLLHPTESKSSRAPRPFAEPFE
jgi:hypothetical protein